MKRASQPAAAAQPVPPVHVFGVRHLSPGAAHHLRQVLNRLQPEAVLVEGPSDADEQIAHLVHEETRPPLALLAYTRTRPVRSILYPLAEYSPEWVALTWAIQNRRRVHFIDLPAAVFLEMHQPRAEPKAEESDEADKKPTQSEKRSEASEHTQAYLDDPYQAIARLAGDPDHETWWERHFEHTNDAEAYAGQALEFGRGLREIRALPEEDENLIREAFMRRRIREVLAAGHAPAKILVVCGAFHAPALNSALPAMSDEEVATLPRAEISLTLMPYSYYRLSAQSGYGAGNHAPAYYQQLFEEYRRGDPERLPARFLSELAGAMREDGHVRSPAEVIEAVRLARSLAALSGSPAPCLRDLRDAAVTCLGRGEPHLVHGFLAELEVGHAVGQLPKGVSRTALQDDFCWQVEKLKLSRFQVDRTEGLELDLRENRFVKSEEAALLDRKRSTFLHRLRVLGIQFASTKETRQDQGTWKECWSLRWTPECEIQVVEASLEGDTIDGVAALKLSEKLAAAEQVDQAAEIVREAACCQLTGALEDARRRLQAMTVEGTSVAALARAADCLSEVIRYGSVRRVDPEPLRPLLQQLFLRATLSAGQACVCDRHGAGEVRQALLSLQRIAGTHSTEVDAERWYRELANIAATDSLNALLSGVAAALLLEQGRIDEQTLAAEVSRRLSPGMDAECAAGWFEGLVSHNHMALFSRISVWRQLDAYIVGLDEEAFLHALVHLRRAFADFQPGEIRRVVSILVEMSPEAGEAFKAAGELVLDDEEARKLQEQLGDLGL